MIYILVILSIWFATGDSFDPSKIDYCNLKCYEEEISSGCPGKRCFKDSKKKTEIVDNMQKFRQQTLDSHNELRNHFAKGLDKEKYPKAANMHVANYDLELEHIARCYIMGSFTTGHDKCRMTSYCKNSYGAGQNLYGNTKRNDSMEMVDHGIGRWYRELAFIPKNEREDLVKHFHSVKKYEAGHFTQVVWGSVRKIGCVRVWFPTNNVPKHYNYILACNYAGTDDLCPANLKDTPMYEIGEPCTKCGNEKCNSETGGKYDGLCGESIPAPDDPPTEIMEKEMNKTNEHDNKKGEGSTNMSKGFFTILSLLPIVLTKYSQI